MFHNSAQQDVFLLSILVNLEIFRLLLREKGGYGHPYFDFTAAKSSFGVVV